MPTCYVPGCFSTISKNCSYFIFNYIRKSFFKKCVRTIVLHCTMTIEENASLWSTKTALITGGVGGAGVDHYILVKRGHF